MASDTFMLTVSSTATTTINLEKYAVNDSLQFISNSYKDVVGTDMDIGNLISWNSKFDSGEANRSSYLRMLGELPGKKLTLINIDVAGSLDNDSFYIKSGDGVTESFDGGSGIDTVTLIPLR